VYGLIVDIPLLYSVINVCWQQLPAMAVEVAEDTATIAVNESLETTTDNATTGKEDGEDGSVVGWLTVLGSFVS
jgi:hypothetical protein